MKKNTSFMILLFLLGLIFQMGLIKIDVPKSILSQTPQPALNFPGTIITTENQTIYGTSQLLEWNPIENIDYYRILRNYEEIGTSTSPSFLIEEFTNGHYNYTVLAINGSNESDLSNKCNLRFINHDPTFVPAGSLLLIENQTLTTSSPIMITWNYNDFAEGYLVFWNNTLTHNLTNGLTTQVLSNVPLENSNYYLSLIPYNRFGNASTSPLIKITMHLLPDQPSWISVNQTIENQEQIILTWASSRNAIGYRLILNGSEYDLVVSPSKTINLPSLTQTLIFEVQALNSYGSSLISEPIAIQNNIFSPGEFEITTTNQTNNGTFLLDWQVSPFADSYTILRNGIFFGQTTSHSYEIVSSIVGITLFQIEAENQFGITYSNKIAINVSFGPPQKPIFYNSSQILHIPHFSLSYFSQNATVYYLFLNGSLNQTTTTLVSSFNLPSINQTYNFTLISSNSYGNSSRSNSLLITISIEETIDPPTIDPPTIDNVPNSPFDEFSLDLTTWLEIIIASLGLGLFIAVVSGYRKKNN